MNRAAVLDGGAWSLSRPGRFTSRYRTPVPLSRKLDGPRSRSVSLGEKFPAVARIRTSDSPARCLFSKP